MKIDDFIKVELSVDIELRNGSIELKNQDYYWFKSSFTKPGESYLDAVSQTKALLEFGRLRMVTIDVLKGNTQSSTTKNIYSIRMIESASELKVARLANGKYNFDDDDTITTQTPESFVSLYGAAANEQAMYHWIEWLRGEEAA
jgi:hypothetical protein